MLDHFHLLLSTCTLLHFQITFTDTGVFYFSDLITTKNKSYALLQIKSIDSM